MAKVQNIIVITNDFGKLVFERLTGYWECDVGVGEGLVQKREVPPLAVGGLETVCGHGLLEYHSLIVLLSADRLVRAYGLSRLYVGV